MKTARRKIEAALRSGWPVLLIGQPGIGKTALCRQVSDDLGCNLLVEVATTADPCDARGLPALVEGRADYQPYGLMRQLIEAQSQTICLIDDLGHAAKEVQKAYMHLVLARRAGSYEISPHVRFIAATNDIGQQTGVTGIISPLQNRFFHIRVVPHAETWCEWAQRNQLAPEVISFVRATPVLFDSWKAPVGIEATCTPRSLHMLSDFLNSGAGGADIYQGCIGREVGLQFAGYLRLYRELENIENIIKDPSRASVPKGLDRRYAICAALACQTSHWNKIVIYLGRLPMEMQVLCVSDAIARTPELKGNESIRAWMQRNKEMLL
jgi:hypothetical protein